MQFGVGVYSKPKIRKVRSSKWDCAGGAHPFRCRRIDWCHCLGKSLDTLGSGGTGDIDVFLDGARNTVQEAELITVRDSSVSGIGSDARLVCQKPDDRVEFAVALFDSLEVRFENLTARCFLCANFPRKFKCSELPQFAHASIITHR
jgi:hypothetical protein